MHQYLFHIKDYRAKTAHLTPLEHYIYRTLIDWYYLNEKPFESVEQIARYLLLPLTDDNKMAIGNVLGEFFNYHKGKYHHKRINTAIKNYRYKNGNEMGNAGNEMGNAPKTNSERVAKAKAERKTLINELKSIGITVDKSISINDLRNLHQEKLAQINAQGNANLETLGNEMGNETGNEKGNDGNGKNEAITINHKPITINQEKEKSVREIFEFWKSTFGKDEKTKLSPQRKTKITARLKDGYAVEQIKQAIVNCSKSEFHTTNNHTDLELICRSVEKLDYFLGLTQIPKNNKDNDPYAQYGGYLGYMKAVSEGRVI